MLQSQDPHADATKDQTPASTGRSRFAKITFPTAITLGVVGAIADFKGARPSRPFTPLAFFCVVVALFSFMALVMWSDRQDRTITALAAAALCLALVWPAYDLGQRRNEMNSASIGSFGITSSTKLVEHCPTVSGVGEYPEAKFDVWLVEQASDNDYYPKVIARKTGSDTWQIDKVAIGGSKTQEGAAIHILIVLLDKETSRYIQATDRNGINYSSLLPPHSRTVIDTVYSRRADPTVC
jgi:hypothetical protein